MDDGSVVLASKDYRIYVYRYLMSSSTIGATNGNATATSSPPPSSASPISSSSSSTTPNSSQILAAECMSPSLINGHAESPPIGSNGF